MANKTYYCLDSNILMGAYDRDYPRDVCPGYWDLLEAIGRDGEDVLYTTPEVFKEMQNKDLSDPLKNILNTEKGKGILSKKCFIDTSKTFEGLKGKKLKYENDASDADLSLIALAQFLREGTNLSLYPPQEEGLNNEIEVVLVSAEVAAGKDANRVKIPDVCKKMDIKCIFGSAFFLEVSKKYGYKLILSKNSSQTQ